MQVGNIGSATEGVVGRFVTVALVACKRKFSVTSVYQ